MRRMKINNVTRIRQTLWRCGATQKRILRVLPLNVTVPFSSLEAMLEMEQYDMKDALNLLHKKRYIELQDTANLFVMETT